MLVDTHAHISKKDYEDINSVINNMENNIIITSMASIDDLEEVLYLIEKFPNVYGTLGIHPEYASEYNDEDIKKIESHLNNKKIVGIGEIGLDYHYNGDKEKQKELFIKQIKLANKYKMPIVIHSREASLDTLEILKKYKKTKAILHCFSGSLEMAKEYMRLNVKFGIGGVLTFKNEKKLKEIVKELELSNFVLETDSPYLTPEPYRGKKNQPANVKYVALKIAELKGISVEDVEKVTTQNAIDEFDLKV